MRIISYILCYFANKICRIRKYVYLCNTKQHLKTKKMKTINEERIENLRVLDKIITLKYNVQNGCFSDKAALAIEMNRLGSIKNWAIENNQIQEIRHYFASKNFGMGKQFIAAEIATYFNN